MRSDLHDPLSKQAMKSKMAGEADLRNTVCLLQSRCATRGKVEMVECGLELLGGYGPQALGILHCRHCCLS